MKTFRIVFAVAAVAAVGIAQEAAAQKGDLDVTMRVLDDVRGVDAVIVAIGAASDETAKHEDGKPRTERAAHDDAPQHADNGAHENAETDDALEPQHEDDSEGALEDHDRAKDLEPAPAAPPH